MVCPAVLFKKLCFNSPQQRPYYPHRRQLFIQLCAHIRSGWRIPCRRRLLLRPASGNPPKRRQWLQLSTTNLQCLTPITLSFSFSLYPSCSLSFSVSLITILHPPWRNSCRNLTFTEPQTLAGSLSPFSLFTFSLRNPRPHFPPFSLFTFSL